MLSSGQLVKVAGASAEIDGIVFDTPSAAKVVVAVIDRTRGPVLRAVNAKAVTTRDDEGPDDRALRLLVRRTPRPVSGRGQGATGGRQGRSGFKAGTAHRSTGR
jgi:hypothetical protein